MKPVAWQYEHNSEWHTPFDQQQVHRDSLHRSGYKTRDLYAIPEGYVVVPVEPTEKQLHAIWREIAKPGTTDVNEVYRAMIEAAQEESE